VVAPFAAQIENLMTRFIAFAVDTNGAALARYDLAATEPEAAEQGPASTSISIRLLKFGQTIIGAWRAPRGLAIVANQGAASNSTKNASKRSSPGVDSLMAADSVSFFFVGSPANRQLCFAIPERLPIRSIESEVRQQPFLSS
jgi:hypothetical protein